MASAYGGIPDSTLALGSSEQHPSAPRNGTLSITDAVAGAAGGVTSVLLGQPFDLIRVRLQTGNSGNAFKVTKDIWVREGPLAFYKGAAAPFIGVGVCVSIQFSVFHKCREFFEKSYGQKQISASQAYLAGIAAGSANSVISSPIEHIRTRLQLQPSGAARLYNGPGDCARQIVRQAGYSGLFKAYPVALVKEAQAFGCYFAAFEVSIAALGKVRQKQRSEMSALEVIPCGALGGIGFWVGSFPIDVIKTKLQADAFGAGARYRSVWAAVHDTWRQSGFLGFWRGLSPTLIRTSLSSAGCFAVVEEIRRRMN